ncbi:MAG: biotin/lipoyl-containing protein, partial [Candidatus Binatia bacterium]
MDIRLPQLAEGVESGTVVNILVSEGDRIEKDQALMELETQKAVGSIPSPESGTVTKIHVKEGEEVTVGQLLVSLSEGDRAAEPPERGRPKEQGAVAARAELPAAEASKTVAQNYRYESEGGLPPPASPSVRKLARELGIDLTRVQGSERGGRITVDDLRAHIQRLQQLAFRGEPQGRPMQQKSAHEQPQRAAPKSVDFSQWGPVRKQRLSSLRRTVGQRMLES